MRANAVLFLAMLLCGGVGNAGSLRFLYIEAAEGNSSGGHAALQLSDKIYHYQYDNGYLRLFRQAPDVFLNDYRFKQNRSVHTADIKVSGETSARIEDYFKIRYEQQKQQLLKVKAAQQDLAIIQALLTTRQGKKITGPESEILLPRLPGAGLFYRDRNDGSFSDNHRDCLLTASSGQAVMEEVKAKLRSRYGEKYLHRKIETLREEIRNLKPSEGSYISNNHYGYAERYSDLVNGLLALDVIRNSKTLLNDVCFRMHWPEFKLSPEQKVQLARYYESLEQSILSLVTSKRPDWGYALFVSLARMQVIRHTLKTGRWTFLDDTGAKGTKISQNDLSLYRNAINKLRHDDEKRWVAVLKHFEGAVNPDRAYAILEIYANRFRQWQISSSSRELRFRSENSLPQKEIGISAFLVTALPTAQLEKTAVELELANQKLITWDNKHNAYHLLTNNCVTALLAALDASVSGQSRIKLGGYIDPTLNAIPFQAYEAVLANYRISGAQKLPGYRELELAKYYKKEEDSLVYARESNVFTSSLYRHHKGDAWFLFFTDDGILLRPLFGVFNVLAATSQSTLGLVTWPFDEGRVLKTGLKGMIASLPELAFFNIRKGSYPYPLVY